MNVDLEFLSELSGKRPEMDAHEILKGLWLGSYSAAESPLPVLKRFNITHILTIEQTCEPVYPNVSLSLPHFQQQKIDYIIISGHHL